VGSCSDTPINPIRLRLGLSRGEKSQYSSVVISFQNSTLSFLFLSSQIEVTKVE